MRIKIRMAPLAFFMICCSGEVSAQFSRQDRKEMEKIVQGDLYLRNNLPLALGRRSWVTFKKGISGDTITEVSPTGVDFEKNLKALAQEGRDGFYWGFGPNDLIRYAELSFKKDIIVLWAEGVPPKDFEVSIGFVHIKNLDDFKKAFDLILSHKPLQDEHPEWPEEIRRAIASKHVIKGMTRAQAFIVLGNPVKVEEGEKDGKKTETWFPRQKLGISGGWTENDPSSTGLPMSVQFVDGQVTSIIEDSAPIGVKQIKIP